MQRQVSPESIRAVVEGTHNRPYELLGPHDVQVKGRKALAIRAFLPHGEQVWVVDSAEQIRRPMRRIHAAGVFEAIISDPEEAEGDYQLQVASQSGEIKTMHDHYAFQPLLSDLDLYLLGEGRHFDSYRKLGAQPRVVSEVTGINFAVWAPNASRVAVVGNFNEWDDRQHVMRPRGNSGVWELFVPELETGEVYKYRIKTRWGESLEKSDPYGFAAELPPRTASIVTDLTTHQWEDGDWIQQRMSEDPLQKPISIYEVHLGSWKHDHSKVNGWMNYRDLAHELVEYCLKMGYTHVELLPVCEHPFTASWGYQTVGYFAATSRHGSPEDLMYFVDHCHQNGLGVILDWVPAHFPRDAHGLRRFDGTALYEHEDPRQGEHPDWGTMVFNYGRNEIRNFLISNALFWIDQFHIDGLRVDAVASMLYLDYSRSDGQWIPNQYGGRENLEAIDFVRQFNDVTHQRFPGVLTIAEESTAWGGVSRPTSDGGLGFSIKWNMGWMNDTLRYFRHDPIHRSHHHNELTFSLVYAFTENFALPFSHDEVVHGKRALLDQMPGDMWQKFANLRMLYTYMWTHPGKKLLFMGSDFGQWTEWNHESPLPWDLLEYDNHRGVQSLIADLNQLYRKELALFELDFDGHGFEWIDCHSESDSVLCYLRKAVDPNDFLVICCNFTPIIRTGYRVGVPRGGTYREIFNSDSSYYNGSNAGNGLGIDAVDESHQGRPHSLTLDLPPLAAVVLKPSQQ
ncbi:MAG: 1,4-alpha-glucan branching protein GlgB [Pirellulaceae bacterium]